MKEIDWKYSSTGQKLSHYDIRLILIIIWVTSLKLLLFYIIVTNQGDYFGFLIFSCNLLPNSRLITLAFGFLW